LKPALTISEQSLGKNSSVKVTTLGPVRIFKFMPEFIMKIKILNAKNKKSPPHMGAFLVHNLSEYTIQR